MNLDGVNLDLLYLFVAVFGWHITLLCAALIVASVVDAILSGINVLRA
jgi:hypothetical protein